MDGSRDACVFAVSQNCFLWSQTDCSYSWRFISFLLSKPIIRSHELDPPLSELGRQAPNISDMNRTIHNRILPLNC